MKLRRFILNSLALVSLFVFYSFLVPGRNANVFLADNFHTQGKFLFPPRIVFGGDSLDSTMVYPLPGEENFYSGDSPSNPMYLGDPDSLQTQVEYDPETGLYKVAPRIGNLEYRTPSYFDLGDYRKIDLDKSLKEYWRERSAAAGTGNSNGIIPSIYIGGKAFDKVFGGHSIDLRPSGNVTLKFGLRGDRTDNPDTPERLRRQVNFDFKEDINMSLHASIGDKIGFNLNYNTKATFNFENKLKLGYTGSEDEIIQSIEAGNVSLPLNSTLITGSQSLFGIKTKLKFGRLSVTSVFSEQRGESKSVAVEGGGMRNEFLIHADEYEENKHFFLNHYFRDTYERSLKDLRLINSKVTINKVEVWVTNIGPAVTENRNIVAFTDLGETDTAAILRNDIFYKTPGYPYDFPDNRANNLFDVVDSSQIRNMDNVNSYLLSLGLNPNSDFEKIELAKRLDPNDYTLNSRLGFISLNVHLNPDQALAVAYQYQVVGDSTVYQVGEFSDQGITGDQALAVKLLRGTYVDVESPLWDLMMKNVYSLNAYQVNAEDFILNILYSGNEGSVPAGYFEEGPFKGVPLLHVFNLDNLDAQQSPYPDGMFDFVDQAASAGGTIESQKGEIFFPVLEPFGSYLRDTLTKLGAGDLADKYCFDELYRLTKTAAEKYTEKNKFELSGYYKSQSGNEIDLHALNIPRGSVQVTAGGIQLTENVDYTVDYTLGRVRIINEGILNSGTPINVSLESKDMFNVITKRLMGTHLDYDVNKDIHLGATLMNLSERPITQKVNYGDDPISNTIWGVDYAYQTKSRMISKIIDKLPFYSTSQESTVSVDGEFAHFIPGHHRSVGKEGISYIDDFEGTKSSIDMRMPNQWHLASVPQNQNELFPEALQDGVVSGFNRAKLSWYVIDNTVFYARNTTLRPEGITDDSLSNHFVRQVLQTEVFPNRDIDATQPTNIAVLDVAYYPKERGPYNYDVEPSAVSAGLNADGTLNEPASRWAGMMRAVETSDFEAANVEYIEFWMMDPFAEGSPNDGSGGELYFDLGDISEDILKDSRKSFENGLPTTADDNGENFDTTAWGIIPDKLNIVESFSNDLGSRKYQDVGYDGLPTDKEKLFFYGSAQDSTRYPYIAKIQALYGTSSKAYQNANEDPSADNFHHFRGDDYDQDPLYNGSILQRYKNYRGPDGNSPESNGADVFMGNSHQPDAEDINGDNTLSESERYYQYKINLRPDQLQIGKNYVTDIREGNTTFANGDKATVNWYQFKIPIRNYSKVVGNISDFRSIRFMRMFLRGFSKPVVLRFATLDLVRGEWRTYPNPEDLLSPGENVVTSDPNGTRMDLSAVSIEENSTRYPVPYVLPPGIEREMNVSITKLTKMNEQALSIKVTDLDDGAVVAAYKTTDLDLRQYGKLKMFVHAEKMNENDILKYGDLSLFVRIGSDFTQNYYDYEIPLTFTPWGTASPEDIWPADNELNIDLAQLVNYKKERNKAMRTGDNSISITTPYRAYDGKNIVTILGNPAISDVKSIMIGIRNPRKNEQTIDDDGLSKSAEIWVNELRLTDFNSKTGWAARSRASVNLADLGNVAVSGMYSSPWFASIDKKVNEIQLEGVSQFDVATNLDLGKLLPKAIGLSLPMHYDFSQTVISPKYNPLDPDLDLSEEINSFPTAQERDSIRQMTMDITKRKNINFMNVKFKKNARTKSRPTIPQPGANGPKIKAAKKKKRSKNHFYDLSNITASYSFSEVEHSNIDLMYDRQRQYFGSLAYAYSFKTKPIKPFAKIGFIKKTRALLFLKDFNFFLLPKNISYSTDMTRTSNARLLRNKSFGLINMAPNFMKTWDWKQNFNFAYDLTQSLHFTFASNTVSFINELPGSPTEDYHDIYAVNGEVYTVEMKRDSVKKELLRGGTKKHYDHNASLNYTLPFSKIPMLDWISSTAGYQTTYQWNAAPVSMKEKLGSIIANNRNYNLNGTFDFKKLYNKSKFLKKTLKRQRKKKKKKNGKKKGDTKDGKDDSKDGKDKKAKKKEEEDKVNYFKIAYTTAIRAVLGVKKVNFTYSVNEGTTIPGFQPDPGTFGNDWALKAPGYEFLFGYQPGDPAYFNQWLVRSSELNTPYLTQYNESMSGRATVEPFPDFKIKLNINRTFSRNQTAFYTFDQDINDWNKSNFMESGSFQISTISWGTAFGGSLDGERSQYFETFKEYRHRMAERIAENDPRTIATDPETGYPEGYGPNSQDVMLPAFTAAYTGQDPNLTKLNPFKMIPLPNWEISYKGLSKIDFFKRFFKSFTINHRYKSSYGLNSYQRSINYASEMFAGMEVPVNINPVNGSYFSKYEFGVVNIMESFEPLIGLQMKMNNSLNLNVQYKRSRNLSLSFTNNQLTEITNNVFTMGVGYTIKDLRFKIKSKGAGSARLIQSDLILKLDIGVNENKTVLRAIDTDLNQISAGMQKISTKFNADYQLSKSLKVSLFYDRIFNNPFLPSQYVNANSFGGFALQYSLAQ